MILLFFNTNNIIKGTPNNCLNEIVLLGTQILWGGGGGGGGGGVTANVISGHSKKRPKIGC